MRGGGGELDNRVEVEMVHGVWTLHVISMKIAWGTGLSAGRDEIDWGIASSLRQRDGYIAVSSERSDRPGLGFAKARRTKQKAEEKKSERMRGWGGGR